MSAISQCNIDPDQFAQRIGRIQIIVQLVLGMGRGVARSELQSFGVELADSRDMFDQSGAIIMEGAETTPWCCQA